MLPWLTLRHRAPRATQACLATRSPRIPEEPYSHHETMCCEMASTCSGPLSSRGMGGAASIGGDADAAGAATADAINISVLVGSSAVKAYSAAPDASPNACSM
eukprot:6226417-Amphidinium_carterae.1